MRPRWTRSGAGWAGLVVPWAALVFAGLILAGSAWAADDGTILYPGKAAQAAPRPESGLGRGSLVVGLLLAVAGGWLLLRGRRLTPRPGAGQALRIEETRGLGNRQYLVVAAYEDKKFLLGVCQGRIEMLAPLSEGKPRE